MAKTEFFDVVPVPEALAALLAEVASVPRTRTIRTEEALGKTLATAPTSPMNLPNFTRSTMDGYAVKAADTFGATQALPAYLTVAGHVNMGEEPAFTLGEGEAAEIHTGAMLPDGADAVVMIERTQQVDDDEIEVLGAVAPGENLVQVGEDIAQDSEALPAGHTLRPQDIGGLLAVGVTHVTIAEPVRVGILSCGDELVDARESVSIGQIRDINSHMLAALVMEHGATAQRLGIARDTLDSLLPRAREGLRQCDMLLLSAGSSVSTRDLTSEVINQLGAPGILQHGLAVKPGKPTIVAACDGKPVIGLPGNPVSAMLVARQIVLPTLQHLLGKTARPAGTIAATLTQNIASTTGREDTVPVLLHATENGYEADPIFGKSNLIYVLLRADGLVTVPLNTSGTKAGEVVQVQRF